MVVGDVLAASTGPVTRLPTPHPYPAANRPGRSGLDVGPIGTRREHLGCAARTLVASHWLLAAIMPILPMSVGAYKPQYPAEKSIHFRRGTVRAVLATTADDEAA